MATQFDMFPEAPPQLTLWGEDHSAYRPDADDVRARLHALLAAARALDPATRPLREWRVNAIVFPQMSNWLPSDEAAQLCLAFEAEIKRLRLAA